MAVRACLTPACRTGKAWQAATVFCFLAGVSFFSGRIPHCLGETARLRRLFRQSARHTICAQFTARCRIMRAVFHDFPVRAAEVSASCFAPKVDLRIVCFLLNFRSRDSRTLAASKPSSAPSSASRCILQSRSPNAAGHVHGVHICGASGESTNAAQRLSAASRACDARNSFCICC